MRAFEENSDYPVRYHGGITSCAAESGRDIRSRQLFSVIMVIYYSAFGVGPRIRALRPDGTVTTVSVRNAIGNQMRQCCMNAHLPHNPGREAHQKRSRPSRANVPLARVGPAAQQRDFSRYQRAQSSPCYGWPIYVSFSAAMCSSCARTL